MASRRDPKAKLQFRKNLRWAKQLWPAEIGIRQVEALRILTESCLFSVPAGDLLCLQGNWYVTHSGLLQLAHRKGCCGIQVQAIRELGDAASGRFTFKAIVFRTRYCRGYVGHGDADPSNVSPLVRGAEMRVAETRAVNRALRKAYGIGICSVEEIGSLPARSQSEHECPEASAPACQRQWRTQAPRPALSSDPPTPARCSASQAVCRRVLRNQGPPPGQPRAGRFLY